jgi:hypothetical protein
MATWERFEAEAGGLAAEVRRRFEAGKTHVLATLRRDGAPRVSGSEVEFLGREVSFGSMLHAVKALDLRRDGRCAIHAHPCEDGDAKIAGVAYEVSGAEKEGLTTGSEPPGDFHAFRLDLREAVLTRVEDGELVIRVWRPGKPVETHRRK